MRPEGLEPPRVAPQDPKSCASTSSATVARLLRFNLRGRALARHRRLRCNCALDSPRGPAPPVLGARCAFRRVRSEEHTSELQSRLHLVCRLLLEKKNKA